MKRIKLVAWPHPIIRDPNYVRDFPITTKELEAMTKKKAAKKKAAKKTTKRAGSARTRVGKGAKSEPTAPLPGMEDVDEKVEAIDDLLNKILANDMKRSSLKQDNEKLKSKIGVLMAEHKLETYKTPAGSVCVLHGEDVIVVKKTKQK